VIVYTHPRNSKVVVKSYPVKVNGKRRTSYEVLLGERAVARFLYLDLRRKNRMTAIAFADGFAGGLTYES
jgi:hypothetical protein